MMNSSLFSPSIIIIIIFIDAEQVAKNLAAENNTYALTRSRGFQKAGQTQLCSLWELLQGQNQGAGQDKLFSEDSGK